MINTDPYRNLARRVLVDATVDTRYDAHKAINQLCTIIEMVKDDRPVRRVSLTRRQDEVWRYVAGRIDQDNITPTHKEIKIDCQLSQTAVVHDILNSLEKRGYLVRLPGTRGAMEILIWPEGMEG